ncbi:MAG: hypothetical protein HUU01_10400 [Saprospiraceae bacterium]|nr:hypothetical protein [Saprospiraceae bacterium]
MLRKDLNKYKKRLARHIQIDLAAQRAGRKTTKRTLDAIENNRQWVAHYEAQLEAAMMTTN